MISSKIRSQSVFHYEKNGVKITKLITNANIVINAHFMNQLPGSYKNIIKSLGGKIKPSSGHFCINFFFETYSKCNPEDTYDAETGERIARVRANKLFKQMKWEILTRIEREYNTVLSAAKTKLARGIYADIKRLEDYVKPNNSSR